MSVYTLSDTRFHYTFSPHVSAKASATIIALPFQIKQNIVNHKKMVRPPSITHF